MSKVLFYSKDETKQLNKRARDEQKQLKIMNKSTRVRTHCMVTMRYNVAQQELSPDFDWCITNKYGFEV